MIPFIQQFLGKYAIYIIAVVAIVSIGSFAIIQWENAVKQEALAKFNEQQLQIVIDQQAKFNQQLVDVAALAKQIQQATNDQAKVNDQKFATITEYLDRAEKNAQPASDVLKSVVKQLQDQGLIQ